MSERNKDKRVEYRLVGYYCSFPDCDWKLNQPLELWQALPIFGEHNLQVHSGTIAAHLEKKLDWAHPK